MVFGEEFPVFPIISRPIHFPFSVSQPSHRLRLWTLHGHFWFHQPGYCHVGSYGQRVSDEVWKSDAMVYLPRVIFEATVDL
jgi:hypothetical protein